MHVDRRVANLHIECRAAVVIVARPRVTAAG
jgi:hypothetical protein